ncbi:nucleotidyltransferase family protein [Polaribacter sp. Z022]|uniref:nucleotidyltransferase family protein n=1 Tax=Polaribacter sp. Z022 TaxID=2927125 RepID=UPI002020800A|nr:nucleotidyltransferase family protein [Polaribacter sp. Z022]MCL7753096.1 nucleotidyltransferase family protein [Polaribacter sp. Z022]
MEEVIQFKKSFFNNSFPAFFKEFIEKKKEVQHIFVANLKKINLDLFFYQALKKYDLIRNLDDELVNKLKREFLIEKGRDEFYKNQFGCIIKSASSPIVLLKGWQLRDLIGFDLYKRSCDVDLLVREKDFKKTISFLEKDFNFFQKSKYIAYGQQCMLNENSMCIDLHKKLIAFKNFDSILNFSANELFKETNDVNNNNGVIYYVFKLEMELIHLCIHFLLHHEGYGFILVYELMCFINNHFLEVSINELVRIAKKHKCLTILIYTFLIIQNLCALELEVNNQITDFIRKYDYDLGCKKSFKKEFNNENFYKNKGIPNEVLEKLLVTNYADKISFEGAGLNFKVYCFFKSLWKNLKIA